MSSYDNGVLLNSSGAVSLNAKDSIVLAQHSSLDTSTDSVSNGGDITITAAKLAINNADIQSNTNSSATGTAGHITIKTQELNMTGSDDANAVSRGVFSRSYSTGDSGDITVASDRLTMSGKVSISASAYHEGNAGVVHITGNSLTVLNKAQINSSTFGFGNAGDVGIYVKNILVDGQGANAWISSGTYNPVLAQAGTAGVVHIAGDNLTILNGGKVSSQTFGAGDAGDVKVYVANVFVDGKGINDTSINSNAENGSLGKAGSIIIESRSIDILNGGFISSSTFGGGNAGDVHVSANSLRIDGYLLDFAVLTGVFSRAESGSSGQAGLVFIDTTDNIVLYNHGKISSSSTSRRAGDVFVSAPVISIDNSRISSTAKIGSTGETGNLTVLASKALSVTSQSSVSIQNNATVADLTGIQEGLMIISAPEINLKNSSISAGSTGNVNASDIAIHFTQALMMDSAFITASAVSGNGGSITINGGELINLQKSGFLTSVTGANGNGGDINVAAHALIMDNGVIQANAVGGKGGDINLKLQSLIPSQSLLIKGGAQVTWEPFVSGLNVIQAASANGVNGEVSVSSPKFNISGSLIGLETKVLLPAMEHNPCLSTTAYASSLTRVGKGGLPIYEVRQVFVPQITMPNVLTKTAKSVNPELLSNRDSLTGKTAPCAAL